MPSLFGVARLWVALVVVRWSCHCRAWVPKDDPLRVKKRWNVKVDTTSLFAALDDETRKVFPRWTEGQPENEEMVQFLEALMVYPCF